MTFAAPTPLPNTAAFAAWLLGGSYSRIVGSVMSPARQLHDAASSTAGDQSSDSADAQGAKQPTEAALRRVLVVDDEALVRRTLALFLTRAGFAAAAAENGAEALELLRAGEVGLLVTDQSMPGMTGCELIGVARELRPGLPALLVSGYDVSGGAERLPGDVPLLRKPIERATFLDQVRALLGLAEDGGGSRS